MKKHSRNIRNLRKRNILFFKGKVKWIERMRKLEVNRGEYKFLFIQKTKWLEIEHSKGLE